VVQRFFFYRVDTVATGTTIGGKHNFAIQTGAHKTQATLTFVKFTFTRTKVALNTPVTEEVPVSCRYDTGIIQGKMFF
jgi:hypothetical protein